MWQIISKVATQYICAIISMIGVYFFGKIVLEESSKISRNKLFVLLQVTYICYMVLYSGLNQLLKTIGMFITNALFYKCVFKTSLPKSILLMFMYTIILIIADFLSLCLVTEVLNFGKTYGYEVFAGGIVGNITVCIILLIITFVLRKVFQTVTTNKVVNNVKIVSLSVLTLISILLFFYTIIKEFRFTNNIIIYLVAIAVLMLVLLSLIKQTIQNNRLLNEYDKLLEFMTTYENEIENQRILRHEIKNEFRTIRAKICDQQENKEIIEYIDEIVNDKYEMDKEKYAKFGYLPPNGIKGLCYFKIQEAEEKGIKVNLNISKRIKNSTVYNLAIKEQRDFGRIMGVFLDNAIEASLETKEKQLGIEAYVNSNQEFKMIITNTYDNKIDKSKIGIDKFSTKGKNRGHGLLLVNQIIGKNKKIKIRTDIQENIYIQTIEIKKL